MTEKEGTNGMAVPPATADSGLNLPERLAEAAARLQERNTLLQEQRLQAVRTQTDEACQELENARLHTAEAEAAQQALEQQLSEARKLLQDAQERLAALQDTLQTLRQQDAAAQTAIAALQQMNGRTDESLQTVAAAFGTRYDDWVEKLETLTDDLHTDRQTMQGLKKSSFLRNEAAWEETNSKLCALTGEVETLWTRLGRASTPEESKA